MHSCKVVLVDHPSRFEVAMSEKGELLLKTGFGEEVLDDTALA